MVVSDVRTHSSESAGGPAGQVVLPDGRVAGRSHLVEDRELGDPLDPYGVETVTVGGDSAQWQQNPYGFKAGLRSSSTDNGLTKFGYRWQSSTTGAWIERDTLDAPLSPGNANRYAYSGADPVNGIDATGMLSSFGTYAGTCATGAFTSLGIGLTLGTTYTPWGAVGEAALGCAWNVGAQFVSDTVSQGAGNGVGYIDFLLTVGKIGKAIR